MGARRGPALTNRDKQDAQNAVRFPGGIFLARNGFTQQPLYDRIWLVSFMDRDLGYVDDET
jgi:hypothetical protein